MVTLLKPRSLVARPGSTISDVMMDALAERQDTSTRSVMDQNIAGIAASCRYRWRKVVTYDRDVRTLTTARALIVEDHQPPIAGTPPKLCIGRNTGGASNAAELRWARSTIFKATSKS